jgi:hypothetical protein
MSADRAALALFSTSAIGVPDKQAEQRTFDNATPTNDSALALPVVRQAGPVK